MAGSNRLSHSSTSPMTGWPVCSYAPDHAEAASVLDGGRFVAIGGGAALVKGDGISRYRVIQLRVDSNPDLALSQHPVQVRPCGGRRRRRGERAGRPGILGRPQPPVERTTVVGETRYRLLGKGCPPVVPTALQSAALHFARDALGGREGTDIVDQLDALLARWDTLPRAKLPISRKETRPIGSAVLRTIEEAQRQHRRLALEYRGADDHAPRRRETDPLALCERHGALYLVGYDLEREAHLYD